MGVALAKQPNAPTQGDCRRLYRVSHPVEAICALAFDRSTERPAKHLPTTGRVFGEIWLPTPADEDVVVRKQLSASLSRGQRRRLVLESVNESGAVRGRADMKLQRPRLALLLGSGTVVEESQQAVAVKRRVGLPLEVRA